MSLIFNAFRRLAAARPLDPAIIDGATGTITTRKALLERTDVIGRLLVERELRPRDFVAIQVPNSVDFVAAFLAIARHGLVAIPIDRDARESEVATILSHFGVRALIYCSRSDSEDPLMISVREASPHAVPEGTCLIKLTSGSTGLPKGILTTEQNLAADCRNICSTMGITESDRNLGVIPFSHSYGFSNLVMPLLLQGTAIVAGNQYLPLSILELANRYGCTVFPGIPMIFDHLAQLPREDGGFVSVRTFISAGAPLTGSASRRFRERFGTPIHTFYGCSECGGIAYDREGAAVEKGIIGKAMNGVELVLARDTARLTVRSSAVASGYILGSESDRGRFSAKGFLTDDLADMDGDVLSLTGRVGDLINIAGKKVNPREIEQVIAQMPGVRDVKVYGEPAGARGEVVAAAVVGDPDITRESVRLFCRERLSTHKVPRIVKLIDALPRDERGKLKRSALELL